MKGGWWLMLDGPAEVDVECAWVSEEGTEKETIETEAEGLKLFLSDRSTSGYKHVYETGKRWQAVLSGRDGKRVSLGTFETAVEGAIVVARHFKEKEEEQPQLAQAALNDKPSPERVPFPDDVQARARPLEVKTPYKSTLGRQDSLEVSSEGSSGGDHMSSEDCELCVDCQTTPASRRWGDRHYCGPCWRFYTTCVDCGAYEECEWSGDSYCSDCFNRYLPYEDWRHVGPGRRRLLRLLHLLHLLHLVLHLILHLLRSLCAIKRHSSHYGSRRERACGGR